MESLPTSFWLLSGSLLAVLAACAALIAREPRRGAVATAVFAALANAYLLKNKFAAGGGPSTCNVNAVVNCDVVNSSAASEMFGIPITVFGLAFYLGLAIAGLQAGPTPRTTAEPERARFDQINVLFAIVNLIFSAYLAYQSKLIGAVCLVCVSIYLANVLLLGSGILALRRQSLGPLEEPGGVPVSREFGTITAVFLVVTLVLGAVWNQRPRTLDALTQATQPAPAPAPTQQGEAPAPQPAPVAPPADALARIYHQPRGPVESSGKEPTLGAPGAKYTLLEFADYGCPHCAMTSKLLHPLVERNPDLQLRFRVFPLTGACNPALQHDAGPERCYAALAAECAGRQGKFWEMSALLFANQPNFSYPDLSFMAKQVGLDVAKWDACLDDPSAMAVVQADAIAGAKAGIQGTPTFFLLGAQGSDWIEVSGGIDAVDQILATARAGNLPAAPPAPPPDEH